MNLEQAICAYEEAAMLCYATATQRGDRLAIEEWRDKAIRALETVRALESKLALAA